MRRWFLSFNSSDRAVAERLKGSIERQDAGSRVFFDATGLRAGGYWQPALAKGIDEADAFVLLVGEKECLIEATYTRDLSHNRAQPRAARIRGGEPAKFN